MGIRHLLENAGLEVVKELRDRDVVFHLRGQIFAAIPEEPLRPILSCEGYTTERRLSDGRIVGREVLLFCDFFSGEVLEQWSNPFTNETVDVLHDWLDPVNAIEGIPTDRTYTDDVSFGVGCDTHRVVTTSEVITSPLRPSVFTREVSPSKFQRTEVLRIVTPSISISMVRTMPWLPWMLMASVPGSLVVHLGGALIQEGFPGLPDHLRAYVHANRPEFAFSPIKWETPNETSWSLYGKERQPS